MLNRRISRRDFLSLGGSLFAFRLLEGSVPSLPASPMRIGAILTAEGGASDMTSIHGAVAAGARMGTQMAAEEYGLNAELMGLGLEVVTATVSNVREGVEAARDLIGAEDVFAFFGGFGDDHARALSQIAAENRVPFLNVGSSSDALRAEGCERHTFHVEPSAAMYLDALSGWYIQSGFRRWFFVREESEESAALHRRSVRSMRERHFGAREEGAAVVASDATRFGEVLHSIRRANADLVVLLLGPENQLRFLKEYDEEGFELPVAGFPHPPTQTRAFFNRSRTAAPRAGAGHRAAAWETTLDAYGARELNSRFRARWHRPMEPAAWATYQAVKILYESALFHGTLDSYELVEYLAGPSAIFDVWKGIGTSFRPWDHQLRQSLYLVKIRPDVEEPWNMATLVGELPAIYMPGTDPIERLDQLGDTERESRCRA